MRQTQTLRVLPATGSLLSILWEHLVLSWAGGTGREAQRPTAVGPALRFGSAERGTSSGSRFTKLISSLCRRTALDIQEKDAPLRPQIL